MDVCTLEMSLPLETIFVPGCPNSNTQVSKQRPMKEQMFVADLPILTEQHIQVRNERTDIPNNTHCSTNLQIQNNGDIYQKTESKSQDDSLTNNVRIEPDRKDFKEEISISETPRRNIVSKKKVRNKRLRTCDTLTMEPKFVCNICTTAFQRINNYTIHMRKKHQIFGDPKPYACPNCPRKYEFEYELKRHMKKYKPLEERLIFPCTQCDRKFQTRVHANRHISYVHENSRPFVCEECGESVHTSSNLKEHMLTHTDYSPFQCKECGKCFKQRQRLKRHMDIHGDKHVCTQCGKHLSSRATLKKHLVVHTEGNQHKCEYCGRAFKLVKTLKVHLNTHTGNKTYECEFCDKLFSSNSSCLKHKKKMHPEKLLEQKELSAVKNMPSLNAMETLSNNDVRNVASMSENFYFNKPQTPFECYNINTFI